MMSLKQAKRHAKNMTELHKKTWLVCRTPDNAACNQYPANVYNTGRYVCCKESERDIYQAGGAEFID